MTIQIVKRGKPIMFDSSDWALLNQYKWWVDAQGYARTQLKNRKCLKMHRFLLGLTDPNIPVDHVNHVRADNRRVNIRVVTWSQNAHNATGHGETQYKGVTYQTCRYKSIKTGEVLIYRYLKAKIRINDKLINLGTFTVEEDAARAYNEAAIKYFGEFANLNVIE